MYLFRVNGLGQIYIKGQAAALCVGAAKGGLTKDQGIRVQVCAAPYTEL